MKIYAEITMMVAIEMQETDEDTIKDKFADCVRYALDNSEITDYEYIDVLELRKSNQNPNDKTVFCNGKAIAFSYETVSALVKDQFYYRYSQADLNTIIDCVMWIAESADVTLWEESYEQNLVNAVDDFLRNHTVYDLDNLQDHTIIFDNIEVNT